LFIKNILNELGEEGNFSEKDFDAFFKGFDKNGSETIPRKEIMIFIKNIAGL